MARHFRRRAPLSVDIRALGVPELQNRINKLTLATGKTIVRRAMRAVAKRDLKPSIDANIAKVSPGEFGVGLFKRLKTKMRVYKSKTGLGILISTPTREKLGLQGDDVYYPLILEKGSSKRGIEPQNMLRRARDQKASVVKNNLGREIGNQIDKAVKKIGKKAFR